MADLAAWYAPGSLDDFEQGDIFPNATIPNTAAVNLANLDAEFPPLDKPATFDTPSTLTRTESRRTSQ